MRYVTYERAGTPRLGAVTEGRVVDVAEASGGALSADLLDLIRAGPEVWERARAVLNAVHAADGVPLGSVRLCAPLPRPPRNVFCLGRNYYDHAIESTRARGEEQKAPEVPIYFTK